MAFLTGLVAFLLDFFFIEGAGDWFDSKGSLMEGPAFFDFFRGGPTAAEAPMPVASRMTWRPATALLRLGITLLGEGGSTTV